jgi:hypothetical protein
MPERKKGLVERGTSVFGDRVDSKFAKFLFPQKYDGITHELTSKFKEEILPELKRIPLDVAVAVFMSTGVLAGKLLQIKEITKTTISSLPELLGGIERDQKIVDAEQKLQELKQEKWIAEQRLVVKRNMDNLTSNK